MSELDQLIAQLERDEYAAVGHAELPAARRSAVRATVVRARRVRTVTSIAVAAALVVACGTGAWALTQGVTRDPAAPTATPTVTTSPSASPTPTPSASASAKPELSMPAFAGTVTDDPRLPSAEAITPEAWNAAGPGWVLATYREAAFAWDDASQRAIDYVGPQVAYLVSPDGVRYQISAIASEAKVRVVAWRPTATSALAIEDTLNSEGTSRGSWVMLDLVSGTTRPLTDADVKDGGWDASVLTGLESTTFGAFGWEGDSIENASPLAYLAPALEPQATNADEATALATAQALVPTGEECLGALALESMVAVACGHEFTDGDMSGGAWFTHYVVYVADSGRGQGSVLDVRVPTQYGNDTVQLTSDDAYLAPTVIGDTVVATGIEEGFTGCWTGRFAVTPGGVSPLPGVASLIQANESSNIFFASGVVGDAVYTGVSGGCSGEDQPESLVRDNVIAGTWSVLVPAPANDPTGASPWITESLLSAYVVPQVR